MSTAQLIRAANLDRVGQDSRELAKRSNRGELIRVGRGVYVKLEDWNGLDAQSRYGLRALAFQCRTGRAPVFCHATAALAWGLWIVGTPRKLHVLTEAKEGGRSRNGIVRHRGSLDADVVRCGPVLVTGKLRTTLQLITSLTFPYAVAVCDSSLRVPARNGQGNCFTPVGDMTNARHECSWSNDTPQGQPLLPADLKAAAELLPSRAARNRAAAVIDFSSGLSGSAGESMSRAKMHELGFPAPALQRKFVLRDGSNAFVDFWFKEQRTAGEFDGMGKYLRRDWGRGMPLQERIMAEKRREDQIRAQGAGFVRWTWEDMMDREGFQQLLREAGLPQK